jgi:hypothetical protein
MPKSMVTHITCPSCGKTIEVTEALVSQIQSEVVSKVAESHKKELVEVQKKAIETAQKEFSEKTLLEMSDLKKQLKEKETKVQEMRDEELKLREEKRALLEREKDLSLEVARKIDEERKRIEETAQKQASESFRLKEQELEKKLKDTQVALEDAQRKASQSSQQLQGEVQELDLEHILKELFPNDSIEPVGKGIKGADISHTVKSPRGIVCGVILWESKRTKSWSDDWTTKLKDDLRASKANIPVIVTTAMPSDVSSGMGLKDGVWVTTSVLVPAIASLLRKSLLDVAFQKAIFAHQGDKADLLYEYVTGHEFQQQIEAIAEVYKEMQEQVGRERVAFEKSWKAREAQALRMIRSTATIYGNMQGLIGSSLPELKGLGLTEGEEDSEQKTLL